MKDAIKGLIDIYIETAIQYGYLMDKGEFEKASQVFESNEEVSKKILNCGDRGRNALANLLDHNDSKVQIIASSHLLKSHPERSIELLEKTKNNPGFEGFYSIMLMNQI